MAKRYLITIVGVDPSTNTPITLLKKRAGKKAMRRGITLPPYTGQEVCATDAIIYDRKTKNVHVLPLAQNEVG